MENFEIEWNSKAKEANAYKSHGFQADSLGLIQVVWCQLNRVIDKTVSHIYQSCVLFYQAFSSIQIKF